MAVSNRDRVGRALELTQKGLHPFVERTMRARKGSAWVHEFNDKGQLKRLPDGSLHLDTSALLRAIDRYWGEVFSATLDKMHRSIANELIATRNNWAHDHPFGAADTMRALDSAKRLLEAVSAKAEAEEVDRQHHEVMRATFEEQARNKVRYKAQAIEGQPKPGLKPWRAIVTPHKDVASGHYAQAEFAADLAQVHRGEGAAEYRDPQEFYRRTYLTAGLRRLLSGAMRRLSGTGGDPVVELQTNFGGGKTHSMLALFHLVGATKAAELPGVEELMKAEGLDNLPSCERAVLVGTALSPGQPHRKPDGTETRTLWGELAWQLGGASGYALVAASDESGVSPGSDVLTDLLKRYSPCLILIDEWVAYVRQLYRVSGLPAGSFDANLTFAQVLTEAAKAAPQALVVASLPASQIEIGGEGGAEALARLKNTFGRVESSWQPATPDEGFEIVRRRLFEPIVDRDAAAHRDAVIKAFGDMYRGGAGEFPTGCGEGDYARRMASAYPLHPELFERLHNDWGALDKFQRTRGVLRFMACAIHILWERGDGGLMLLPASIPLDSPAMQGELVRYLDHNWSAVLARDIDGPTSCPLAIDGEVPTLGRYSATRRVARTVWLGSAPAAGGKNPGIDDRRIKLGAVQPGESPGTFGDALRRLADRATFLYQDSSRYWFSTQPSVSRLAEDRAAQVEAADVEAEIVRRLKANEDKRLRGEFAAVHAAPEGSAAVADEPEGRLVILGPKHPHSSKGDGSRAEEAAKAILETRGSGQRIYRNALAFAAADAQRLPELEAAVRSWKAWSSIAADHEALNLDPFQKRQAETKAKELDATIETRQAETWSWALAPHQPDPRSPTIEWDKERISGAESLPTRVAKKLMQKELFFSAIGPLRIRNALESWLWGDRSHLPTRQLHEWLASYLYLPRLKDADVLRRAIEQAIGDLANDMFAYAQGFDEATGRYLGLKLTGGGSVTVDSLTLVVRREVAAAQAAEPKPPRPPEPEVDAGGFNDGGGSSSSLEDRTSRPNGSAPARRYAASVMLDPARPSRDMGKIAEEVIAHLSTLPNAKLRISLEIEADLPEGVPEDVQRTVLENGQTLKFGSQGFERG